MGVCLFVKITEHFVFPWTWSINKQMSELWHLRGKPLVSLRGTATEISKAMSLLDRACLIPCGLCYSIEPTLRHALISELYISPNWKHLHWDTQTYLKVLFRSTFRVLPKIWFFLSLMLRSYSSSSPATYVPHYITSCQRTISLSKHISGLREKGWEKLVRGRMAENRRDCQEHY